MGRMALDDMMVWAGEDDMDSVLSWHLFSNHFPPLPEGTLALAKEVIAAFREGEPDRKIDISSIGAHRRHGTSVPARVCAEAWHLDAFIVEEEEGA